MITEREKECYCLTREAMADVDEVRVVDHQDLAQLVIKESCIIQVSKAEQDRFVEALISPPKATPALKRAIFRHNKLVTSK